MKAIVIAFATCLPVLGGGLELRFDCESKTPPPGISLTSPGPLAMSVVEGVSGHALRCNGNDPNGRGEIVVQRGAAASLVEGSIAFWVKVDRDIDGMNGGWDYAFVDNDVRGDDKAVVGPRLGFNPREGCLYAGFPNTGGPQARLYGWDARLCRHSWNHLCMTWKNDGQLRLYVNGELEGRYAAEPYHAAKDGPLPPLYVGPGIGMGDGVSFDELAVFPKELSPAEVKSLATAKAPFLLDYPSTLKSKVVDLGQPVKAKFLLREPVEAVAELLSGDGRLLSSAPATPSPGNPEVSFSTKGVQAPSDELCYARLRSLAPGSTYAQAFSVAVVAPTTLAAAAPGMHLVAGFDFCRELRGDSDFKENLPSQLKTNAAGTYRETDGFFSCRFKIKTPGRPHLMVVEYPDDALRTMAFDINDGSGSPPQGAGVVTGFPGANSGKMARQELVFWPASATCALSVYNWATPKQRAAAARMSVHELEGELPALDVREPADGPFRQVGTQVEDASAPGFWGGRGQGLARWSGCLDHMVAFMRHSGQNAYEYPMMWYAGPLFRTPYNDAFGPGDAVRAGHPDGSFQLILKKFAAAGLKLYPELYFRNLASLDFPSRIPGDQFQLPDADVARHFKIPGKFELDMRQANLAGKRRVAWVGQMAQGGPGRGPIYNPLHPLVQKSLLALVDDFLAAVEPLDSFGGLKLDFTSWGGTPSLESLNHERLLGDYSDFTVGLFAKETGTAVPGADTDPTRFLQRHAFLTSPAMRGKWVAWRCAKIHAVIMELARRLWAFKPDAELILAVTCPDDLGPKDLGYPATFLEGSRECGIDPVLYTDPRVRFEVYESVAADDNAWAQRGFNPKRYLLNNHPDAAQGFVENGRNGFVQWLCYWEMYAENPYHVLWPEVAPNPAPVRQITPAGDAFLKLWAERLANVDYKRLHMGGMGGSPMQGHRKELGDFVKAFRHMPAREFSRLPSNGKTVVGRGLRGDKRSYCYFVNRERCPMEVTARFEDVNQVFSPVDGATKTVKDGLLSFSVPPYGLVSFSFDRAGACVSFESKTPQVELDAVAAELGEPASDLFAARLKLRQRQNDQAERSRAAAVAKLPVITWQVLGPFGGAKLEDLAKTMPPEAEFLAAAPKPPRSCVDQGESLPLETVRSEHLDYQGKLHPGLVKLDMPGTFYAFTTLKANRDLDCTLAMGVDDWALARLNGAEVLAAKSQCMGLFPDTLRAQVHLKQGLNHLAVKLVNGGGPGGFSLTLQDTQGAWPQGVVRK